MIKEEEYGKIPTRLQYQSNQTKYFLKHLNFEFDERDTFSKFKDMSILTDEECFELTRWNRNEFMNFRKYITSVYDTAGRTCEELIAIYRFWLRKGTDQMTLAMFKKTSNQQKISHYLSQIRNAIYNDFVPFFLGANKQREFYLQHNNSTVIELHQLKREDLAIFVDGTYSRIEKSSNNQFQYKSWSQQKQDLLIKPFIICCADGYFIECYGPFQANQNDAKILEYILETDNNLKKLLEPNKTFFFLDRGIKIKINVLFFYLKQ
jgi:hypothetical protein